MAEEALPVDGPPRRERTGAARPGAIARGLRVAAVLMTLVPALPTRAEATEDAATLAELRRGLDAMRARQDTLEAENAELRSQLADLEGRAELPPVSRGRAAPEASVGLKPGGGGYFIQGDDYSFRLLGYAQAVGSLYDSRLDREDGNGDFSIRRARIDFLADFLEDYQLFIEFDGGVASGTPGSSDFGLVEARLNWKVMGDALQLRLGKFTTPFSQENYRSSRDIDTVERFLALNSLFLLPAFDPQFGAMVHGQIGADQTLGYFLGVFNGNGRANDNFSDSDDHKEMIAKLTYSETGFSAGLAFDYTNEGAQTLSLADLAFDRYVSVPVEDRRVGVDADLYWERDRWSVRAEGVAFRFDSPDDDHADLIGGFVQPAYFLSGNRSKGLQLLLRAEMARLSADTGEDGDTLYSATLGANWFVNPNVRVQFNGILQYFDGSSELLGLDERELVPLLLTEVQFKF